MRRAKKKKKKKKHHTPTQPCTPPSSTCATRSTGRPPRRRRRACFAASAWTAAPASWWRRASAEVGERGGGVWCVCVVVWRGRGAAGEAQGRADPTRRLPACNAPSLAARADAENQSRHPSFSLSSPGTQQYVHVTCLRKWQSVAGKREGDGECGLGFVCDWSGGERERSTSSLPPPTRCAPHTSPTTAAQPHDTRPVLVWVAVAVAAQQADGGDRVC